MHHLVRFPNPLFEPLTPFSSNLQPKTSPRPPRLPQRKVFSYRLSQNYVSSPAPSISLLIQSFTSIPVFSPSPPPSTELASSKLSTHSTPPLLLLLSAFHKQSSLTKPSPTQRPFSNLPPRPLPFPPPPTNSVLLQLSPNQFSTKAS